MALKENKLNRAFVSKDDIFQKYLDIAFSDITDYTEFGVKEVEIEGEKGKKERIKVPYVNIKNSDEVDGTLISEISDKKVKLLDRMKALEWLTTHMNFANKEQKAKYDKLRAEIDLLKVRKVKAEEEW